MMWFVCFLTNAHEGTLAILMERLCSLRLGTNAMLMYLPSGYSICIERMQLKRRFASKRNYEESDIML